MFEASASLVFDVANVSLKITFCEAGEEIPSPLVGNT
jgi:hypothetical protein